MELKIAVPQMDEATLVELVARHITREYDEHGDTQSGRIHERIEERVDELVTEAVNLRLTALVAEHLDAAVAEVVTAGWQMTNSYGQPTGVTQTLSSLVREKVTNPRFGGDAVEAAVRGAVTRAIAEAKVSERVKAAIDTTITAKFAEALRAALGVR